MRVKSQDQYVDIALQTDRHINKQTDIHTNKQTDRQIDVKILTISVPVFESLYPALA